ncbi:CdaR family protein [Companilactobacillus jidongensis]|uniref:CdaR family protein n=1 Tax=Companilactobacillus jidongensis TaxID=2486006 RepID=UPI001CDCFE03|nr:CdaR family protein [Companilactobacillus jidongensis]
MMKKIINSNYFYAFIALCAAIWLFLTVSSPGVGSTRDSNQSSTSTVNTKTTLTVPLQVQANTNDYYITGYPDSVKITIEGPSALVTATKNTQNFNLYLNLKKLSTGQHRVQIKETGLNSELTYTIKPKYVDVNIQKRKTKTFAVDVDYTKSALASGYEAGKITLSPETVSVTGAASEVNKIKKVVVKPILPKGIKTTFDQEVLVQALDKNGKTVNVTLDPQTVHVKIPISMPSKEVSINLTQKGSSSNSNFSFESDVKTIRIYGTQDQLDAIDDSIDVPVDVSDVTQDTKKTINLADALGNQVTLTDPETLDVNVSVSSNSGSSTSTSVNNNSNSTNTNSNNNNGSSNTNTSSDDSSTSNNSDSNNNNNNNNDGK